MFRYLLSGRDSRLTLRFRAGLLYIHLTAFLCPCQVLACCVVNVQVRQSVSCTTDTHTYRVPDRNLLHCIHLHKEYKSSTQAVVHPVVPGFVLCLCRPCPYPFVVAVNIKVLIYITDNTLFVCIM